MRSYSLVVWGFCVLSCSASSNNHGDSGHHGDAAPTDGRTDGSGDVARDVGPPPCIDTDMDGISDNLEHHVMPGVTGDADDEDGDGFSDLIEGNRSYPLYDQHRPPLMCSSPDDCDSDGIYDFQDLDSDNDGLTDAEERMYMTDPCNPDT